MKSEYRKLLKAFKLIKPRFKYEDYVAFHSMVGNEYNNDIMFVGRALNGWNWKFNLKKYENTDLDKFYNEIHANGMQVNKEDQLNWVRDHWKTEKKYQTSRSAFWRTIQKIIVNSNTGTETNWNQKIVWSNLFKISNINGNPRTSLIKLTKVENRDLLNAEILHYNPKFIVFLTGIDWFKHLFDIDDRNKITTNNFIEYRSSFNINNKHFEYVVAPHPQGKKESIMASYIINELKEYIKSNS